MLLWVKPAYLQGLQKCCFPVKIKQPAVSSPSPSQPALYPKKAVARPLLEWRSSDCSVSSVLCYFLPLPLQKSCSFSHTGRHTELIASPSSSLFSQASVIQLLWELKNLLLWFWRLGTTSSVTCKAYLEQNVALSPLTPCKRVQAVTALRYLETFFFLNAPSALISIGAGCLICLCTSENPIKCLFTSLGA